MFFEGQIICWKNKNWRNCLNNSLVISNNCLYSRVDEVFRSLFAVFIAFTDMREIWAPRLLTLLFSSCSVWESAQPPLHFFGAQKRLTYLGVTSLPSHCLRNLFTASGNCQQIFHHIIAEKIGAEQWPANGAEDTINLNYKNEWLAFDLPI